MIQSTRFQVYAHKNGRFLIRDTIGKRWYKNSYPNRMWAYDKACGLNFATCKLAPILVPNREAVTDVNPSL